MLVQYFLKVQTNFVPFLLNSRLCSEHKPVVTTLSCRRIDSSGCLGQVKQSNVLAKIVVLYICEVDNDRNQKFQSPKICNQKEQRLITDLPSSVWWTVFQMALPVIKLAFLKVMLWASKTE